MVFSKKIMYGVALTLCLISLSTVIGMGKNTGSVEAIVEPFCQDTFNRIHAHIAYLQNMITAILYRRTLQSQADPESRVYIAQITIELTNHQERLNHELQLLQQGARDMNSVVITLNAIIPVINGHYQRAINRLQVLCDTLFQEFHQNERVLNMVRINLAQHLKELCIFLLLIKKFNQSITRMNNVDNTNLPHIHINTLPINDKLFLSLTHLRDLRTAYDTVFQRLAHMFDQNSNQFAALQRQELNTLDLTMRVESYMLDIIRIIARFRH